MLPSPTGPGRADASTHTTSGVSARAAMCSRSGASATSPAPSPPGKARCSRLT